MDNGHAGYMGAVRWVSFRHHGDPESGEVRTMDDGSVWARISDLDPRGDDDRWVLLLDPAGVEAPGVSEVRFHDVTVSVTAAAASRRCEGEVRQNRLHPRHVREWGCTTGRRPGRNCSTISSARGVMRLIPKTEPISVYCFSVFTGSGIAASNRLRALPCASTGGVSRV